MSDSNGQKRRIQPEMLVGISAVFIGVCALGVSLYETSLMREQQRAAVIPMLELMRSYNLGRSGSDGSKARLYLQAQNVGIGPAKVLDFRVTVDGTPKRSWNAAMRALLGREAPVAYGQSTINGRTIPPERTVTMFDLNDTELAPELIDEFNRLDFTACFCSVFDECWKSSYSTFGATTQVESCQRSEDSFDE
jgi:hypothetical protein